LQGVTIKAAIVADVSVLINPFPWYHVLDIGNFRHQWLPHSFFCPSTSLLSYFVRRDLFTNVILNEAGESKRMSSADITRFSE
jgi:hypothetical protein